jgi:hypothetical protein
MTQQLPFLQMSTFSVCVCVCVWSALKEHGEGYFRVHELNFLRKEEKLETSQLKLSY